MLFTKNDIMRFAAEAIEESERREKYFSRIQEKNTKKILDAFRSEKVGSHHFHSSSGYGYNDAGRDKLEDLYACVLGSEAALVRQQIISGTHAITVALAGNLSPCDELLYIGRPYDTLRTVIGAETAMPNTLCASGVCYREVEVNFNGGDEQATAEDIIRAVNAVINRNTKIVALQRSSGYSWRGALSVGLIGKIIKGVKSVFPDIIFFVDNCYGEMAEYSEPTEVGADLMAGSLIKNMGAGIVPCGGYVAGKHHLVNRAAYRLSVPGIGKEAGPSLMDNRLYYEALFLCPQIVKEAMLGAVFTASLMSKMGFDVKPSVNDRRADIIQAVRMGSEELLTAFCRGIQKYSPVDSFVMPTPAPMPGYECDIIMAQGGFVQGSSIELSADAPLLPPYNVFIQGGLNRYHVYYAVTNTIIDMLGVL